MKTWVKVAFGHGLVRRASDGARAGHRASRPRLPRTLWRPAPLSEASRKMM
jgi:hypothetical protein